MRPWTPEYAGRIDEAVIESGALVGNRLGDPNTRPIWIYLPPGYDEETERRYPTLYLLQGYAGALPKWSNRSPFAPTIPERIDAVFAEGDAPPAIVVYVDAWTALGGSQFVDSPGTGAYHRYLSDDVVSFVDARYRTLPDRDHRGVFGHSSGGFGAIVSCMLRPDVFGGFASHAGDMSYELCYLPEFTAAYKSLRDRYDRSYDQFFADLTRRTPLSRREDFSLLMVYAVAACFSAEDDGTVLLPFDPETGGLVDEVWQRWLAWDPIRMVKPHKEALSSLRAVYLDAGRGDEYCLDIGAEIFVKTLRDEGITAAHLELFDGRHSGIDDRYPRSVRYLATALA